MVEVIKLYLFECMTLMIRFNNALLPHGIHFFFPTKVNLYLFVKPAFTFLRVSIILQISVSKNFIWKMFQKRQRHLVTDRIQKNNLIEPNKKNNLKEEIIFGHCKGHDTIIFFFNFEGFYEQHVPLLSRNYFYR